MSLSLRLFRCVAALLFLYAGVAQAQQVTVSNVTPTSLCAGLPVSFSYTNGLGGNSPTSVTSITLSGPGTTLLLKVLLTGHSISQQTVTTPCGRTSGAYTIKTTNESPDRLATSAGFTVVALSAAPTTSNVTYCQNVVAQPLIATGQTLKWHANTSGGFTSIMPSIVTLDLTTYYVSQTNINGRESSRVAITYTVNPLADLLLTVSPVTYCQHKVAQSLQASGGTSTTMLTPQT